MSNILKEFNVKHGALIGTNNANYIQVMGSASGNSVAINAIGSDTDISISLVPKGNGTVNVPLAQAIMPLGTANGVLYLDASKSITSGTGLTFTGTNLGIGTTTPSTKLEVTGDIKISNTTEILTKTSTIDGWTYAGKNIPVNTQETASRGISFSTDGTKMYIVGQTNDTVYQYTLSTPYDVSTATYASKSVSILAQDTASTSLFFKTDGTVFYMFGDTNDTVYQYTMSTAWDVSTATYATKSFSVTTQDTSPSGLEISPDGTNMYVIGTTNDTVYQYTLSTAWDVSTATYATKSFSVTTFEGAPSGIEFNNVGTKMYIVGSGYDCILEYTLSTAWDVTTSVFTDRLLISLGNSIIDPLTMLAANNPTDIYTDFTNNIAYVLDATTNRVYQYSINTTPLKIAGNKLVISPFTYFKNDIATLGSIRALGTIEVTGAATFSSTLNVGGTTTLSGSLNVTGTATLPGGTTSGTTLGTSATTGTTTIGGASQTGTITVGQSTVSQTLNFGTGATTSVSTKTINIGTNGVASSITNINIGSTTSTSTATINATTTINGTAIVSGSLGRVSLATDSGGNISIGRQDGVASFPYLDFNTGSTLVDYDSRIIASGGNGVVGNGNIGILTAGIGIGIQTPESKLHIRNDVDGTTQTIIQNRNATGTPLSALTFISGAFDYADSRCAQIVSGGGSSNYIAFSTSNGAAPTEKLRIDSSGNLGLGVTSPVSDSLSITQYKNLSWVWSNGANYANIFNQTSSASLILASGYKLSSTTNGFASSFGGAWSKSAIEVGGGGAIRFFVDPETTVSVGTDISPTERMRIDSSGNVGIGTTGTVSAKLEVNGTVKFPSVGTSGLVGLGAGGLLSSVTIGSGLDLTSDTLTSTYSYTLPTASTTVLGGVKVDGTSITINGSGVISGASTYTLPTASTTVLGGVKVDGTSITINGSGVISASATVSITDDTSTSATYYPVFSTTSSGSQTLKVSSTKLQFNPSTGTMYSTIFQSLSDASLKTNITAIDNPFSILELSGVKYDWVDGSGTQYGFIAQEVEKIIPELVGFNGEYKSVNYNGVIPFLVETVKKQQSVIEDLISRIEKLENK